MLLEKIKTPGLSIDVTLSGRARKRPSSIRGATANAMSRWRVRKGLGTIHIFETHRSEHFVSGAPILKALTGARVFHCLIAVGTFDYADTTHEGDEFVLIQLNFSTATIGQARSLHRLQGRRETLQTALF